MSDEQPKRTRKANPLTAWNQAKAHTAKVRKAAEKAAKLRERAQALEADAKELDALHGTLEEAQAAEKAAYDALQAVLNAGE